MSRRPCFDTATSALLALVCAADHLGFFAIANWCLLPVSVAYRAGLGKKPTRQFGFELPRCSITGGDIQALVL